MNNARASRQTRSRRPIHVAIGGLAIFVLAACSSSDVKPETAIRCEPGSVEIDVTNVSDRTARYTVSVRYERAGFVEEEMLSSNDVAPGATATISEIRPDEPQTCAVTDVKVFNQ